MADKMSYEVAQDGDGSYHILKPFGRIWLEMAGTSRLTDASLIVQALNEKEERDRVARAAAIPDSVEAEDQTAGQVDRDRIAARPWPTGDEKDAVYLVGDDH